MFRIDLRGGFQRKAAHIGMSQAKSHNSHHELSQPKLFYRKYSHAYICDMKQPNQIALRLNLGDPNGCLRRFLTTRRKDVYGGSRNETIQHETLSGQVLVLSTLRGVA